MDLSEKWMFKTGLQRHVKIAMDKAIAHVERNPHLDLADVLKADVKMETQRFITQERLKKQSFGGYKPSINRCMNVDPLAEQMPSWSSYNYAFSDPVIYTDPTGMAPEIAGPDDIITLDLYGRVKSIEYTNDDSPHIFLNELRDEITFNDGDGLDSPMLYKDYEVGEQVFLTIYDNQVNNAMNKAGSIMYDDGFSLWQKAKYFKVSYYEYDFGFSFIRDDFGISKDDMGELYFGTGFVEGVPFAKFQNNNTLYNVPDTGNFMWGFRAKLNNAPLSYMLDMAGKNEGGQDTAADTRAITNGFNFQLQFNKKIYEEKK